MPPVRVALELIKAGKEPSKVALEAVVSRRLAKWEKGALIITAAGEHAVADDYATREAMRSAQRPRRWWALGPRQVHSPQLARSRIRLDVIGHPIAFVRNSEPGCLEWLHMHEDIAPSIVWPNEAEAPIINPRLDSSRRHFRLHLSRPTPRRRDAPPRNSPTLAAATSRFDGPRW
jgi:hypothetical protein